MGPPPAQPQPPSLGDICISMFKCRHIKEPDQCTKCLHLNIDMQMSPSDGGCGGGGGGVDKSEFRTAFSGDRLAKAKSVGFKRRSTSSSFDRKLLLFTKQK